MTVLVDYNLKLGRFVMPLWNFTDMGKLMLRLMRKDVKSQL